jgi:hypothetical protein
MENKWKTIAIIFIILFTLETTFLVWSTISYMKEEDLTYECFYDVCGDYYDALYDNHYCTCYNEDYEEIKTVNMRN